MITDQITEKPFDISFCCFDFAVSGLLRGFSDAQSVRNFFSALVVNRFSLRVSSEKVFFELVCFRVVLEIVFFQDFALVSGFRVHAYQVKLWEGGVGM